MRAKELISAGDLQRTLAGLSELDGALQEALRTRRVGAMGLLLICLTLLLCKQVWG